MEHIDLCKDLSNISPLNTLVVESCARKQKNHRSKIHVGGKSLQSVQSGKSIATIANNTGGFIRSNLSGLCGGKGFKELNTQLFKFEGQPQESRGGTHLSGDSFLVVEKGMWIENEIAEGMPCSPSHCRQPSVDGFLERLF
jgi:hypothetical protein